MTEKAVTDWQEHFRGCEACKGVIKLNQRALMFNLCLEGRALYYPAWQQSGHQQNPGGR